MEGGKLPDVPSAPAGQQVQQARAIVGELGPRWTHVGYVSTLSAQKPAHWPFSLTPSGARPRAARGHAREVLERRAAEGPGQRGQHERRGLSRLHAAYPRRFRRTELAERGGDGAGGQLTELMTADAGPVLHHGEPVALGDGRGNVALAAELARVRDLEHGVPIDR